MKRKKSSIGCLFWIALILLVLVVFLFNRKTIDSVLENTGFWEIVGSTSQEPEVERLNDGEAQEKPEEQAEPEPVVIEDNDAEPEAAPAAEEEPEDVVLVVPPESEQDEQESETIPVAEPEGKMRRSRLYFVKIETDGSIALKGIVRPVYYKDSPLTETLGSLLKGLSASEINQGLLSLIPDGTRLRSVSVKDGTAYLNFSEEFLFNSFGKEGYTAQLQQIIYSATEFSTVQRVQILINGEVRDYMGSEGVYIGAALDRNSL